MPQLIKNTEGIIYDNNTSSVLYLKSIESEIQREDYINTYGFTAYLQNLTRVEKIEGLTKPLSYGLKNSKELRVLSLNIDY
jgi:hypothetical protein